MRSWYLQEYFDVVNEEDKPVCKRPRMECLTKGLLHRAICVLVNDNKGRIIIQKRSHKKLWYPDYWTLSCTGHVSAGEEYADAAKRELKEELGLSVTSLEELFKFLAPKYAYSNYVEWEFIKVFETWIAPGRAVRFNKEEIGEVRSVTREELEKTANGGDEISLTPDAVLAVRKYLELKGH